MTWLDYWGVVLAWLAGICMGFAFAIWFLSRGVEDEEDAEAGG